MASPTPAPERKSLDPFDLLKYVGSPIAIASALLFYFGWVRSNAQALDFGADISVFEMAGDDLILRSINVVFFPAIFLLLVGLLFLRADPWFRAHATTAVRVLRFSWVLIPIGLVVAAVNLDVGRLVLPICFLLAVAGMAYAGRLRRAAAGTGPPSLTQDLIVGTLLLVGLFWSVQAIAGAFGDVLADNIKKDLANAPSVTLYSEERLSIAGPGVTEIALPTEHSRYLFRYEGLHFLQRSGAKYYLLTDGWRTKPPTGRLVVLPDDESIRLEFSAAGAPPLPTPQPTPVSTATPSPAASAPSPTP